MGRAGTGRALTGWAAGGLALVVLAAGLGLQVAGDRLFRDPGEPGGVVGGIAAGSGRLALPALVERGDAQPARGARTAGPAAQGPAPVDLPGVAVPADVPVGLPVDAAPAPAARRLGAGEAGDRTRSNDDRRAARNVTTLPYTDRADARSLEADEPTSCGSGLATAWYRFTPLQDLDVVAQARTSDGTSTHALAVFTGRPGSLLRPLRCDDYKGTLAFGVRRGTTYWFQVTVPVEAAGQDAVFVLREPGATRLAAPTPDGAEASGFTNRGWVSGDGRTLVFTSNSEELVPAATRQGCLSSRWYADQAAHRLGVASTGDVGTALLGGDRGLHMPCMQVYATDLHTGRTQLVSATPSGTWGFGDSGMRGSSISDDGRYVAFTSTAPDLVPDDTNGLRDVFVRDLLRGTTRRVALTDDGRQSHEPAQTQTLPVLSGDGRHVFVSSGALERGGDLCPSPTSVLGATVDVRCSQVVHVDLRTGRTRLITRSTSGGPAAGDSQPYASSRDGSVLLFHSNAPDLVPGESGTAVDLYVHDLRTHRTSRVDRRPDGRSSTGIGLGGRRSLALIGRALSSDGRWAAFVSDAADLVPGDTNGQPDAFVADLRTGRVERVSVATGGRQSLLPVGPRRFPHAVALSPDGRYAAVTSEASDLVPGDRNGVADVFLHDRLRRTTALVSVRPDGSQGVAEAYHGQLSDGAATLVFTGSAHDGRPRTTGHQQTYWRRLR